MSHVPRGLTARNMARALAEDGFSLVRTAGSHHIYAHDDGRVVVVPMHGGSSTFPIGTLKNMIKLAQWDEEDLKRLRLIN